MWRRIVVRRRRYGAIRWMSSLDENKKLPMISGKAKDEFEEPRRGRIPPQWKRYLFLAYDKAFLGRSLKVLGISALCVYGLGGYEASLIVKENLEFVDMARFVNAYALEQLVPSCVWGTKPADLVALSIGFDPSYVLHNFSNTAEDAAIQLQCLGVAACRSVIAGFVCLTQVLRTLAFSLQTHERYKERVRLGSEPLFGGVRGRILRLCGRSSDLTAYSMKHSRSHIVPVYERPEKVRELIERHSDEFTTPVFWQVSEGRYARVGTWQGLTNRSWSDFLTYTTTGKVLLYMEADATNEDQSLAIARRSTDLNVEDISQAFRSFEAAVHRGLNDHEKDRPFRPFRVLLGDLKQQVRSGSGKRTLRSRVMLRREADVLVDSQGPILDAILKWSHRACGRVHKEIIAIENEIDQEDEDEDEDSTSDKNNNNNNNNNTENDEEPRALRRQFLFDTTSTEYLANIQRTMQVFGFEVIEADAYDRKKILQSSVDRDGRTESGVGVVDDDESDENRYLSEVELPRLIYCNTTAESINAVKSLVAAKSVDPSKCCVLIDEPDGVEALQDLVERTGYRFEVICSAIIYDDLLRRVRGWARLGHTPKEIQSELDRKFAHIDAAIFYTE